MGDIYRCRKCRHNLFSKSCVVNDHEKTGEECPDMTRKSQYFISHESNEVPTWITDALNQGSWSKGKLYCPKCGGRVGSFDFISCTKCPCHRFSLPPVHILCCRVDQIKTENIVRENLPLNPTRQSHNRSCDPNCEVLATELQEVLEDVYAANIQAIAHESAAMEAMALQKNVNKPTFTSSVAELDQQSGDETEITCTEPIQFQTRNVRVLQSEIIRLRRIEGNERERRSHGGSDTEESDAVLNRLRKKILRLKLRLERLKKTHRQGRQDFTVSEVNQFECLQRDHSTDSYGSQESHNKDLDPAAESCELASKVLQDRELELKLEIQEEHCCAVCLDLYCNPMDCNPCSHTFCEPCLRRLAREKPWKTTCPLCRKVILSCKKNIDLTEKLINCYKLEYEERKRKERNRCTDKFYMLPRSNEKICTNIMQVNMNRSGRNKFILAVVILILLMMIFFYPFRFNVIKLFEAMCTILDFSFTLMNVFDIINMI